MTDATPDTDYADMFAALCREVGFCLHPKGEKRVIAALPSGLDAATRAVFEAEGVDFRVLDRRSATGGARFLKANLPAADAA